MAQHRVGKRRFRSRCAHSRTDDGCWSAACASGHLDRLPAGESSSDSYAQERKSSSAILTFSMTWGDRSSKPRAARTTLRERVRMMRLLTRTRIDRRTCSGGAQEQLLSVGVRDVRAVRPIRPFFAWKPSTAMCWPFSSVFLLSPRRSRMFGLPPSTIQLAILPSGPVTSMVNPGVRVDPFHLRNGTLQLDRLLDVEFRRECVMRSHRETAAA